MVPKLGGFVYLLTEFWPYRTFRVQQPSAIKGQNHNSMYRDYHLGANFRIQEANISAQRRLFITLCLISPNLLSSDTFQSLQCPAQSGQRNIKFDCLQLSALFMVGGLELW